MQNQELKVFIGGFFLLIALVFVHRSFYGMRIPDEDLALEDVEPDATRFETATTATNHKHPAACERGAWK